MNITRVRMDEGEGRAALEKYVFGGHYGPVRVPRGIAPEVVSQFLKEHLPGQADGDEMGKVVEVLRFYERPDVLPSVQPLLANPPADYDGLGKQLYVCQMLGDLGTGEQAVEAAACFDRKLVPCPSAIDAASLMLDTLVVLAPAGGIDALAHRIAIEVETRAKTQEKDEASMMAYDKVAALQRNEIPRTRFKIDYKKKLLAQDRVARRARVVRLYLGKEPVNDGYFHAWSGRLLREDVWHGGGPAVVAEFGKALDVTEQEKIGKERATDVVVLRAGRAVEYLGAQLTDQQREKYQSAKSGTMDFLWDE